MKDKWKNQTKVIGYLALIMLLLFSSLPLSGVFAEVSQGEENAIEPTEVSQGEENATEPTEISDGESQETWMEEVTEEDMTREASIEENTKKEEETEEDNGEKPGLDAYLLSGNETVHIKRTDGYVINQGTAFQREYFVTLESYYECEQNVRGNHSLEATYCIYQDGVALQSGTLELEKGISDSFCMEYAQTGEYIIEIKTSAYEEVDGEYIWNVDRVLGTFTEKIEKSERQLQGNIEKEGHFSYREDYGRSVLLSFFVEGYEAERDGELYYTISSSNEAVIKPVNEQEWHSLKENYAAYLITGVGEAELRIQPKEHAFFQMNEIVIPIVVSHSAMWEEDYCISYTSSEAVEPVLFQDFGEWERFLEQRNHWLNGTVTLGLTQTGEQYYEGLSIRKGDQEEEIIEQKQFVLSEEAQAQQYTFWCSNSPNHTETKNVEGGVQSFVVGIDKTAPTSTKMECTQSAYEPTSTNTTKYFGESLVICGAFEDMLSGVERIEYTTQADLGEEAKWQTIQNVMTNATETTYEFVLEQGIYTGIAVRAIDVAGNVSEPMELRSETGEYLKVIVDKTEPKLEVLFKTADEKVYQGEWTNQPITIFVQETSNQATLAGIRSIQYQYVSIGGEYQPEQWIELPTNGRIEIGDGKTGQTNQNGAYYFRAISNTGVITKIETQKKTAVRIRLQQTLPEKQQKTEVAPPLEEGQEWYNKETGVPLIQFLYPEYDSGVISKEYGAPITVYVRLTKKLSDDREAEIVCKTATIGIQSDEEYQRLTNIESDNLEEYIKESIDILDINFSYNEQTGYAEDGIYELEYWIMDAAGNESEHEVDTYKIDTHEPEQLEVIIDGSTMKEDTSQTIYYDRFYAEAVNGSASADFGVSGKGFLKLMVAEEMGAWKKNTDWISQESFVLKPCTSGCIYLIAEDAASNQAILRTQGIVVDNQAPTGENGGKFITITSKANENLFYHDDVQVKLGVSDLPQNSGFSAIESFSCVIGCADKEERKELFSFSKALPSKEELASARCYTTTEIIDATIYEGNDTYVEITARDRSGNIATSREVLKIDVTAPKVEIIFDQNEAENGCYFHTARNATIHVQELNFDSTGIELKITKDGAPYSLPLSEWQTDGTEHFATVAFTEDGDYTLTVSCTDLADNTSEEVCAEAFTIDQTKPEIEITYDNDRSCNEVYYQQARTAYLTVKEHNFRKEDFVLEAEPQIPMSEWSHEGDEHHIQFTFTEDNHYHFQCSYTDLAGNVAEAMEEQDFFIDSIPPQIVISGVEDESANAGEISPIVTVYDTNRNPEGVNISVTTGMGEDVLLAVQVQEEEQGYSYLLTDMSEKEDNVYFLKVTASDMAGNINEVIYRFSLNRNGSTYDLSEILPLLERVYNRTEQLSDIAITEMNVDKIEEYAIYLTRNGSMLSCQEVQDWSQVQAKENEIYYTIEKCGDEKTGFCNRYLFYQENFSQEGTYRITCYSKDRAGNKMNNTLRDKKAELTFVVDNTAPKVVMDGLEEGEIYKEEAKAVHIMVQDNFKLDKARFMLVNQAGEELQSWDYMELVDEAGDVMTISIPSREERQFLFYQVSDAAGNELVLLPDSEEAPKGFLVTTNPWLQFINSPVKVTAAVVVGLMICGVGVCGLAKKRSIYKKKLWSNEDRVL